MANDRADVTPKGNENGTDVRASEMEPDLELGTGDPDFSIGPNAEYYVTRPDDQFTRLKRFIATSGGGVFGLTGVRGAGKSVLLKKIEKEFEGKHHTLHIPAPVSSREEAAFFAMLFRQLCGSVIAYINQKVFKKKTGAEKRGRQEIRKRLYLILAILPVIAAGMYGGWFYWTYYSDHKTQEGLLLKGMSKELKALSSAHAGGVATLVSAVEEGTLAAVEVGLENMTAEARLAAEQAQRDVDDALGNIDEARRMLSEIDEEVAFLSMLRLWERRFLETFGIWSKVIGDMPHPAHVLHFDEVSTERGRFSLEKFLEGRGSSVSELEKILGVSSDRVEGLLSEFRVDSQRLATREVRQRLIAELVKDGSDSFNEIERGLQKKSFVVDDLFSSARNAVLDMENKLLSLA